MTGLRAQPWYLVALAVGMRLHVGRVDAAGLPHWRHLERVAGYLDGRFPGAPREELEAAILHDALADPRVQAHHLRAQGVGARVIEIVRRTSPSPAEASLPYLEWIGLIAGCGDAGVIRVVLADWMDCEAMGQPHLPELERNMTGSDPAACAILEAALSRIAAP